MKKSLFALAITALLSVGAVSQAQAAVKTVTYTADRAIGATNWNAVLGLGKFDTSLGTLTSIKFALGGLLQGVGKSESLDASATDVTLKLAATLTLYRPDASALVITNPLFTQQFSFTAFDGNIDFAGTSGGSTGLRSTTGFNSFTSSQASDFALFSALGGGIINLGLDAAGTSTVSGAGNLVSMFQTSAGGNVAVTYEYIAAVPEPETYAMLLGGLLLVGAAARRKAAQAKA
ncbi:choice-of-anchor E domain-containing protein [Janthinobacterium fluminis]|uniref:Choice-of-anchor E domain-containing protein n=1 Tax=Janthinobacterium fluminis TaxID=2987524 RepID=A0ABT5K472_9BURK|nr:choice-of-anchor E domain-containing protein [Janthinobacterium fluminis]MDC8759739.1 choice-of-anchor E domain-containing protein [Janthinobacterium fluminis]